MPEYLLKPMQIHNNRVLETDAKYNASWSQYLGWFLHGPGPEEPLAQAAGGASGHNILIEWRGSVHGQIECGIDRCVGMVAKSDKVAASSNMIEHYNQVRRSSNMT